MRHGIYTTCVSSRAKQALLGGVIVAILYVLISPLPELDASHLLHFPAVSLIFVVLLLISPLAPPLPRHLRFTFPGERDTFLAQTCVRLC